LQYLDKKMNSSDELLIVGRPSGWLEEAEPARSSCQDVPQDIVRLDVRTLANRSRPRLFVSAMLLHHHSSPDLFCLPQSGRYPSSKTVDPKFAVSKSTCSPSCFIASHDIRTVTKITSKYNKHVYCSNQHHYI